ncbi:oligosaccharide flippase family protein [Pseudoalteromonas porphyrae]|uniref:oligosaccharide flippase family protein n=1 Tax=Pseudoalteromonas porphyrae TaxID=187330 RepID=UPI0012FC41EE|nr:oligosaccharide flippase family protein [Pseudoalteromonas porphyrae]
MGYLGGNSLSQIILLLSIPLLVSVYSVESFGLFGVFSAYLAILSQINGLKFENAILANKKTRGLYYFISSFFIASFISVFFFLLFLIFFDWFYTFLLVLSAFFAYLINIYQLYLVRIERATIAGYLSIVRSVLLISFQVIFSNYNEANVNGLILGCFFSVFILGSPILIWCLWLIARVKVIFIIKEIRSNVEFVYYILPQTLINNVSVQAPIFFIESIWGIHSAGIYTMALKIVQVPSRFMTTVLRNLLTSEFSNISCEIENCYSKARKYTLLLLFSAFSAFSLLALLIPHLVDYFLGDNWGDVVLISRCMLIWYAISFVNIPAFCLVMVYRKLRFLLNFEMIGFFWRLILFSFFYFITVEFYLGMLMLSISIGLLNVYFIIAVLKNR